MSLTPLFNISAQAMAVEQLRVDTVANNLANQNTLKTNKGTVYHPLSVLSQALPFENYLDDPLAAKGGIGQVELIPQRVPPRREYHPGHPAADSAGYLTYPGVNNVDEMTTLIRASRAYEANVKMLNVAHTLALQALSLGEQK